MMGFVWPKTKEPLGDVFQLMDLLWNIIVGLYTMYNGPFTGWHDLSSLGVPDCWNKEASKIDNKSDSSQVQRRLGVLYYFVLL